MEATDKSKYEPMTFLKVKEEAFRPILKEQIKRKKIKFYLTLLVRFT